MQLLNPAAAPALASVRFVLCDLDDTLTCDGRLPAASLRALERLEAAGVPAVIVTGRPAGWCDMMARLWPVAAVVGENGAFAFRYDRGTRAMLRRFQRSDAERARDQARLFALARAILAAHPGAALSADQPYRISDVAIDVCEDVPALPPAEVDAIVAAFEAGGATAKISSIHVNAWIGDFSKLQMSLTLLAEAFDLSAAQAPAAVAYAGDSPNDAPMFAHFPLSVGVANIRPFLPKIATPPRWITAAEGGHGFSEFVDVLLAGRAGARPPAA